MLRKKYLNYIKKSISSYMQEKFLPKATIRCKMHRTKSPNLSVPSFLIYLKTNNDKTSVFTWNPKK